MKPVPRCKKTRASAKSILRLPDLEIAKSAVLNSLSCPDAQRGYRHAIDDSLNGTALNRGCRSASRSLYGTACIWSRAGLPREQSIFVSALCAASRTRPQTAAY